MGNNGRVVYMQRIIQGLDKDSADKLAQKIAEAQKQ
jgi:hypothetical protein